VENSGNNNDNDGRQAGNNGSKSKSKETYGAFKETISVTLRLDTDKRSINRECTRTNPNSSSKQSNEKDCSSDYEDQQNLQRNSKEALNWEKDGPTPDGDSSK
jgi:hypothetical protein